ncbi:hypothetical protein niasHT_012855 [Heterodera trifolii]|uniref:Uncharacterized protein n=1 Tax=Heterodera trifolii TaxID=157864 RepID=A0ABD2KY96_9BILA
MAVGGVSSGAIRKFTSHHLPLWSVFNFSTAETHPKFTFHHLPFSSPIIMPFIAPGTFAFLSKEYGEFSAGEFDPNKAYDPNSLAELSQWRKEFLDGRYGSKQPTPPFTPRASSPSFPIPVIVGRQMFPGDDGYESEDDEILLPPPPVPPQIDHPPPNVPEIRVEPIHDVQQPMPLRDMPQIHHPLRNVTSIWTKLWLLFLSLWVFLQAIHVRQIQRDYAIPQFAHPPPNVPLIFDHPPVMFGNSTTATTATAERRATIRPPAAARTGLFYALEFSRNYQLIDHGISRKAFRYLLQTEKKQSELAIELMKDGDKRGGKNLWATTP